MGAFSIILDPTGAALGLWKEMKNELVEEPATGRARVAGTFNRRTAARRLV